MECVGWVLFAVLVGLLVGIVIGALLLGTMIRYYVEKDPVRFVQMTLENFGKGMERAFTAVRDEGGEGGEG